MNRIPDKRIIEQLQSIEEKEVDQILEYLYSRMYPMVQGFVLKNRGEKSDAKDCFQDGLISFYKLARQDRLKNDINVEAYLFTICRNVWLKKLGRQKKPVLLIEDIETVPVEETTLKQLLSKEKEANIKRILQQLGTDCYRVLLDYYYKNLPLKKIAKEMKYASEAVAKNKKSHCMKKLREMIGKFPEYKNQFK